MPRPQRISRDRVAEVAITLLDEEGVHSLSLDRIAKRLGVRAPSLYHHYPDKAAILDEVAAKILGGFRLAPANDDVGEWMVQNCVELYHRVMRHPNVAHLVLEHMSPKAIIAGFGLAAPRLASAGIDARRQTLLMEGTHYIVWGFIMHRTMVARHPMLADEPDEERWADLAAARRANPLSDEEMLVQSARAFIAGVLASSASE